jgi:predicted PurR-regulated permease PerM
VPNDHRLDVEILLRKINQILNGYLRGQIFLVFLVSLVLFIALSVMGVKFSLLLAVFSGIAEIVPIIGPIVAATVAAVVVFLSGVSNFSLSPLQAVILVVIVYFIVRQIQDYFVTPVIMGRITKLHPLVIMFAVLIGGHSFGILGLILAVPAAAILKLLLDFSFDKINNQNIPQKK